MQNNRLGWCQGMSFRTSAKERVVNKLRELGEGIFWLRRTYVSSGKAREGGHSLSYATDDQRCMIEKATAQTDKLFTTRS